MLVEEDGKLQGGDYERQGALLRMDHLEPRSLAMCSLRLFSLRGKAKDSSAEADSAYRRHQMSISNETAAT